MMMMVMIITEASHSLTSKSWSDLKVAVKRQMIIILMMVMVVMMFMTMMMMVHCYDDAYSIVDDS